MSKRSMPFGEAVGISILVLIISAFAIWCINMFFDLLDDGEWLRMILAFFAFIVCFGILVFCVYLSGQHDIADVKDDIKQIDNSQPKENVVKDIEALLNDCIWRDKDEKMQFEDFKNRFNRYKNHVRDT